MATCGFLVEEVRERFAGDSELELVDVLWFVVGKVRLICSDLCGCPASSLASGPSPSAADTSIWAYLSDISQ